MLKKTIFVSGVLAIMICLPFTVQANSASTRIGISVKIKAKEACDYSYAMESKINVQNSKDTQFSNCDLSSLKLQQQANQIATAAFKTTDSELDGKRLRVFMTVQ